MNFAGQDWWDEVGSWRPLAVAGKMWQDMADGDMVPGGFQPRSAAANSPVFCLSGPRKQWDPHDSVSQRYWCASLCWRTASAVHRAPCQAGIERVMWGTGLVHSSGAYEHGGAAKYSPTPGRAGMDTGALGRCFACSVMVEAAPIASPRRGIFQASLHNAG